MPSADSLDQNPADRYAMIEAGDGADARLGESRGEAQKVVGRRLDIAVRNDEAGMRGRWRHVDQVGDLPVRAVRCGVDDKAHVAVRKIGLEATNDGNRPVVGRLHAENDLDGRRIVLRAKRCEVSQERRFVALQGLENGHWRRSGASGAASVANLAETIAAQTR